MGLPALPEVTRAYHVPAVSVTVRLAVVRLVGASVYLTAPVESRISRRRSVLPKMVVSVVRVSAILQTRSFS